MKNCTQIHNDWAEAYVELQDDELLQLYVVFLSRHEAGRRLLEQARQLWQAQGVRIAPFDSILFAAARNPEPRVYADFVLI